MRKKILRRIEQSLKTWETNQNFYETILDRMEQNFTLMEQVTTIHETNILDYSTNL
jgi:hypothetical protein